MEWVAFISSRRLNESPGTGASRYLGYGGADETRRQHLLYNRLVSHANLPVPLNITPYILTTPYRGMVEFDVIKNFTEGVDDCASIEKALDEIREAGKYGVDYGRDLEEARDILEQRKLDLGCN